LSWSRSTPLKPYYSDTQPHLEVTACFRGGRHGICTATIDGTILALHEIRVFASNAQETLKPCAL